MDSDRPVSANLTKAIARVLQQRAVAALATLVEAPRGVGAKVLIEETGARRGAGTGDRRLDEAIAAHAPAFLALRTEARTFKVEEFAPELERWRSARVLFERIEPEPRVVVCGAGHVGAALACLASVVGYRVTLIDDRADFVTPAHFHETGITLIAAKTWGEAVREAVGQGRGCSVAIVTRGHKEDEECLRVVLEARPDYVGMIGSRRRTNIVLGRLRELGIDEAILREVRAPIGLDIGAVAPEEVALAILAEIVAVRRGGAGAPLSTWRRS